MISEKKLLPLSWIFELALIGVVVLECPKFLDEQLRMCFYTICLNLLVFWAIWVYLTASRKIDLFEPYLLITIIHLFLFEITPLICLFNNDILWFDVDEWGGCIKGTWISTIGYVFLSIAYFKKFTLFDKKEFRNNDSDLFYYSYDVNRTNAYWIAFFIWIIAFSANVYLMMNSGQSISYILTFGLSGGASEESNLASVDFLGVVAYAMISSYLYIFELGKSKFIKFILFYLMAVTFMGQGFRFILVAVIISPFVFIYLKKDKRPKLFQILLILLLLLIMIAFIGIVRDGFRSGSGVSNDAFSSLTVDTISNIFIDNFSIFKTYYGIVQHIPTDLEYTCGSQMILYTSVMFIPRLIWKNKPQPITRKVITASVSGYASWAGTAYPYIGEYYHEFGIIGVIVFMYLLGRFSARLKELMYKKDLHSLVCYVSLYPLLFQVLIRGYTPSNFYMILMVFLPVLIEKSFASQRRKA